MASIMPCKICETEGVQTPADWLITAQSEVMGFTPGNTFYVCMGCLAGLALAWAQEAGVGAEPEPEPVPDEPGVLERIEADERDHHPSTSNGRRRKSEAAGSFEPVAEDQGQAEAAHVQG